MNKAKQWFFMGGATTDVDAQAFFTAAGITDATQKSAVNTLVVALKAAGLWTLTKCLYPYVGGTATTHKFNLKDPRDLDAAYRIVHAGGVTHNANGVTYNASTGWGDTKFNPTTVYGAGVPYCMHSYIRSWTTGVCMGGTVMFNLLTRPHASGGGYVGAGGNSFVLDNNAVKGLDSIVCSSTYIQRWIGNKYNSKKVTYGANDNINIHLGNYGAGNNWSDANSAMDIITDPLTVAQRIALGTIVETFQTTLSRNVVADTIPANMFFFGDSITQGFGIATPTTNRWAALLSVAKSKFEVNLGISGTTLQSLGGNGMANRLAEIPDAPNATDMLFISYCYNDVTQILLGTGGISAANYQTVLATVISNARAKGWTTSQIIMAMSYYEEVTSWQGSGTGLGMPIYTDLIARTSTECTNSGATWMDLQSVSSGGFVEGAAPKIHPDITRHAAIATYVGTLV